MPPIPPAPRPSPSRSEEETTAEDTTTAPPAAPQRGLDLSINKVLAGAGAAATSAVLGSFFGAAGTVTGAALGSVASTVATTIYQHSLDRTRDTIVARVRLPSGRRVNVVEPGEGSDADGGSADPDGRSEVPARRRWGPWVAATALIFLLGLAAVTGVEWIKGSTLTAGQSGTSIGRVINQAPVDEPPVPSETKSDATTDESSTTSTTTTTTPTSTPAPGDESDGSGTTSTTDAGSGQEAPGRSGDESGQDEVLPTRDAAVPGPSAGGTTGG